MTNTKLYIFDWDGTLADSSAHIVQSMQRALSELNIPQVSPEVLRSNIGLGINEIMTRVFPDLKLSQQQELITCFRHHFMSAPQKADVLFPGVAETLQYLHQNDHYLAIATGKSHQGLALALESTHLGQFIHNSRTADQTCSKPNPQMLNELLEDFQLPPEQAMMIGDTSFDMEMAKNANMPAIAVSYGVHSRQTLQNYQPSKIIDSIEELIR